MSNLFEMVLVDNNEKSVTYAVKDYDRKVDKGKITVDKKTKSYTLSTGGKINNQYISSAYRSILKMIQINKFATSYKNGWA